MPINLLVIDRGMRSADFFSGDLDPITDIFFDSIRCDQGENSSIRSDQGMSEFDRSTNLLYGSVQLGTAHTAQH